MSGGRGLACAVGVACVFLLSEVKTTNSFDLYAFPPLNRGFSCVLWLRPAAVSQPVAMGTPRPPPHCCLCPQQHQDAATPEDQRCL